MCMALGVGLSILVLVPLFIGKVVGGREVPPLKESDKAQQFAHRDKPALETFETKYGDIYDCVDFYKQPAFDHPALKNHEFHPQMRPSSRPKRISSVHTQPTDAKSFTFGLKDKSCPFGTVPIRRVKERDLIRALSLKKQYNSSIGPQETKLQPGHNVAIAQTKKPQVYHGVGANLTIQDPSVASDEYTSGLISITGYPDVVSVELAAVSWVNPILYKDNNIRMFIYTEAGGISCFNSYCGFILVRSDIPTDIVLAPFSEPRGPLSYVSFFIYQDPPSGIWWLQLGHDHTPIGFWPQRIFTGLATSGSWVACGGEVYHPLEKPGAARMGSGFRPNKNKKFNAYCFDFIVVNETQMIVNTQNTEGYSNWPEEYGVVDKFIPKHFEEVLNGQNTIDIAKHPHSSNSSNIVLEFEHIVVFGGPQVYQ